MSHHSIVENNDVQYLTDIQDGGDDITYHVRINGYDRSIVRGSKAKIGKSLETWVKSKGQWVPRGTTTTIAWDAYSLQSASQKDRRWMDSFGISTEEASNILTTRLIKRVQGDSVDPTLFLKELDGNFAMVAKRASQALEFLKNLTNPKKLAQLTLRYFKGSETRRSLTKKYSKAKRAFLKRTPRWQTRDWSSSFLEYQFGWRPLCEDVWKLVGLAREAKRRHDQHSSKVGLTPQTLRGTRLDAGPTGVDSDWAEVTVTTCGHAVLRFKITHPWLRTGAALEPPTYTAWDAIPYSWLVDCVTNVGQHLKYALYNAGLTLIGGYIATMRTTEGEVHISDFTTVQTGSSVKTARTYFIQSGAMTYFNLHNTRSVIHTWPSLPWFNRFFNTLRNTELLMTIGAFAHSQLAKLADERRPWVNWRPPK